MGTQLRKTAKQRLNPATPLGQDRTLRSEAIRLFTMHRGAAEGGRPRGVRYAVQSPGEVAGIRPFRIAGSVVQGCVRLAGPGWW